MRRLSDGVEAALHCALVLAGLPEGKVLPGKSLAELHGVSETYLLKHLRALTAAGVIEALPGPRGGYRLARAPASITLLDIVEAIDGREPAFLCREIRRRGPGKTKDPCAYKMDCFIKSRMLAAEAAWRDALRVQTLDDLVRDGDALIDERNKEAVSAFVQNSQR
ncbi:Rrf2 family transcriptional regulator [Ruixingdingia sedimenti]|uniref:Rrf2 family transcriptional regulator n=1 Tax=Ruixingdingia sedimenti TaxID=3073604 RepID=A0ABU1FF61_9RHOB|nr:Rrf2 family transcriptional regulator [Xinfangfangia sp. LG-4]MDR5655531.1 Rrf2 family transcriptional regulator [Xinfangfangia sp. LG-4]